MSSTRLLERYRHISALGTGGMATVVLAEDMVLGRQVALKRMHAASDARALSRLRREALVGASLSHPNLVSIYDVISADEDNEHVIVMEYVRGRTLRDALGEGQRLPVPEALRILDGVAAALDAIHRQGIVHRDVKPANVLLGEDGAVKLADLGIASVADRTRITTDGSVLGTVSYMAPEQLSGDQATPAVDIYALAAVAFEMLGGRKARTEPNPVALAHAISTNPPPDLREIWQQAPSGAAELLSRGMARKPADRPRSASELTRRLRAALEPQTTAPVAPPRAPQRSPAPKPPVRAAQIPAAAPRKAPPPGPPVSQTRRRLLAVALLALVIAAVVLAIVLSANSPKSGSGSSGATTAHKHHAAAKSSAKSSPTAGATASQSSSSTSTPPPSTSTSSPVSATESFYTLAAAHRYAVAWKLADPTFRSQLGGFQSFEAGQAGDRRITFDSAHVTTQSDTSATVAVTTTSVRDNGTQHCGGTVTLNRSSATASWLLHLIDISCR